MNSYSKRKHLYHDKFWKVFQQVSFWCWLHFCVHALRQDNRVYSAQWQALIKSSPVICRSNYFDEIFLRSSFCEINKKFRILSDFKILKIYLKNVAPPDKIVRKRTSVHCSPLVDYSPLPSHRKPPDTHSHSEPNLKIFIRK